MGCSFIKLFAVLARPSRCIPMSFPLQAGDDELPAPIDSVALPSVPPLLYAEPMFAQSSFNPTSRPQRQFPPVDPCALERSAEPGRTSNHPDACQPVHTEDSAVLHSASSVTSSKLEEAQRLAQEALSAFSYPSQDQLFRWVSLEPDICRHQTGALMVAKEGEQNICRCH